MQNPPPYSAPAKKSNSKLIIGLVVAAIAVCCVLPIGFGIFGWNFLVGKGSKFVTCILAYQMMPSAIAKYADANGGKLPDAAKWNDQVRPFYATVTKGKTDAGPFKLMDANAEWGCTEDTFKSGMYFNSAVSGKKLASLDKDTVVLFEAPKTGKNLSGRYKAPPFNQSPFVFGTKERRGWIIVTADKTLYLVDETGKRVRSSQSTFGE